MPKTILEVYNEGREAFTAGKSENNCPYHPEAAVDAWEGGWRDAWGGHNDEQPEPSEQHKIVT